MTFVSKSKRGSAAPPQDPFARHEGESHFDESAFEVAEAGDDGRGAAAGAAANKFDRGDQQRLRVARAPGEFRPRIRNADPDARGGILVGGEDVEEDDIGRIVRAGEPEFEPKAPRAAALRGSLQVPGQPPRLVLNGRELRRLIDAATRLIEGGGTTAADLATAHDPRGGTPDTPLAAAARAWRVADRRGGAAAKAKRQDGRRRDDIAYVRLETVSKFEEAMVAYDDMVTTRAIAAWISLIERTTATYSMNMRFLAAAFTWIYTHFAGAISLAGRTENLNTEFLPKTDANLREIVRRAKRGGVIEAPLGDGDDVAALAVVREPSDADYLVVFAYVVWLKHLEDGEYTAVYDYDDGDEELILAAGDAGRTESELLINPFDTDRTRLVKAADVLGEAHLSKAFQVRGPGAAPPPRIAELVAEVMGGDAPKVYELSDDVARAIREGAIISATPRLEAPEHAAPAPRSMFNAVADAPEYMREEYVYFGGLAATLAGMRAVLARKPRLSDADSAPRYAQIVALKTTSLFTEVFVPLSTAGAIGRDFIGEFASHVANTTVGYALVRYAARKDVREISLQNGAVYSTVSDAFLGEDSYEEHAVFLRTQTEAARARINSAAALARVRSEALFQAKPVAVTKPQIESSAQEALFRTDLAPIEVFARTRPSAAVPFVQFAESDFAATARESLQMTPEFFSTYVLDALAAEAQNLAPSGWGLLARRGTAQHRPHFKVFSGEGGGDLRAALLAMRSQRTVVPRNTITVIVRIPGSQSGSSQEERFVSASLFPVRGEESMLRLIFHLPVTEAEAEEVITPAILAAFPSLQILGEGVGKATPTRVRGRFTIVGSAAEALNVAAFYFSIITLPALRPFFSINEIKRPLSEKPMAPLFHISSPSADDALSLALDAADDDTWGQRSRARIRFEMAELVRAAPGRPTARLPVTFFTQKPEDAWFAAYAVSRAVGLFVSEIAAPLLAILSRITPAVFKAPVVPPMVTPAPPRESAVDDEGEDEKSRPSVTRGSRRRAPVAEASRETISRKITDLRANSEPGTIVENYDSLCACKNQPIIITEDERAAWTPQQVLEHRNRLFVCPDANTPYPIVKQITKPRVAQNMNKEFPCCFVRPARKAETKPRGSRVLASSGAVGESDDTIVIGRAGYIIMKATAVEVGRRGAVPSGFSRLLRSATEMPEREFVRVGTLSNTANSLIHAVLTALDINGYNSEGSSGRREAVANAYRALMRRVPLGTYAQEFPDMDPAGALRRQRVLSEAVAASLSAGRPLDSRLHIRGVEAIFGVRIFVVIPAPDRTGSYEFETPKHAEAHLAPSADAYSVTVVLVRISDSPEPHYEPVCAVRNASDPVPVASFDADAARMLSAVAASMAEPVRLDAEKRAFARGYPFGIDVASLISERGELFAGGAKLERIHIDAFGKMRGVDVLDTASGAPMTVFTPPLPPLPLAVAEDPLDSELVAPVGDRARKVMVADGQLEFVVAPVVNARSAPSRLELFAHNERVAGLLVQFAHWARMVARASQAPLEPLVEWWTRYTLIGAPLTPEQISGQASAEFPDARAIAETVGVGQDPTAPAIGALALRWPSFADARAAKLLLPSVTVRNKLLRFLQRVEAETIGLEDSLDDPFGMVPRYVLGVFTRASDFCVGLSHDEILRTRVFLTPESFNDWLAYIRGARDEGVILPFGAPEVTPISLIRMGSAKGWNAGRGGAFVAEVSGDGLAMIQTLPTTVSRADAAPRAMWALTKARGIVPLGNGGAGPGLLRLDAGNPRGAGVYASVLALSNDPRATT